MGFCMISNVAVVAAALADAGERVMIFDYDAHHGNGTQAAFYDDPRVLFVSYHQWPLYPGTGRHDETGDGAGVGHDAQPAAAAGRHRRRVPRARSTRSSPRSSSASRRRGCIVSAGFDAHRNDPITDLGLSAGDYAPLTGRGSSTSCPPVGASPCSKAATTSTR